MTLPITSISKEERDKLRKHFRNRRRPKVLRSLIMRDKRICGICKKKIAEDETITVDHIIPLSRGGTNSFKNLQLAHEACNALKGRFILSSMKEQHQYNYALKEALESQSNE